MFVIAKVLLAVSALLFAVASHAEIEHPYAEGVVLVGYQRDLPEQARAIARAQAGAQSAAALSPLEKNAEKLVLRRGVSVPQAIEALRRNPNVRYAEPDYILTKGATSNDPLFTNDSLWGMKGGYGSNAAAAWSSGHVGSRQVYVGVIDEGIQVTHPDLAANIWTNPGEICGNGKDDDSNGYVDDCHGWDFHNKDGSVYDPGNDSHGTHVAGTIGGVGGNLVGVAGVNWAVTMISAKFLGPQGGYLSDAVSAIDYLTALKLDRGLDIVATSNSWGGGGYSESLRNAIRRGGDAGILFVAAAGNSGQNNDRRANYPSNYDCSTRLDGTSRGWDCVIAVASITSGGALSSFSNYGVNTVDIGAPGSGITSTIPLDAYTAYSGTSMATPHVSGATALCASINPDLSVAEIRQKILATAAPTGSLSGKTVTGGRLDVGSLAAACQPPPRPPGPPSGLTVSEVTASSVRLSWVDSGDDETGFEVERANGGGSHARIASLPAGTSDFSDTGLASEVEYSYRVRAINLGGASDYAGPVSVTTLKGTLVPPVAPSNISTTLSKDRRTVTVRWQLSSANHSGVEVRRLKRNGDGTWPELAADLSNAPLVEGAPLGPTAVSTSDVPGAGTYRYLVRTFNDAGYSNPAWSAAAGVTAK